MTVTRLSDALTLRSGVVLKNRAALAPLTNQQSHEDGTLGEDELRFLRRRAAGGFGLIETCAAHVDPEGQGFDGQLGVWGDHQLPGLTRLASAVREHGALPVAQLFHGGVRSPSRLTGVQPVSASVFDEGKPGFEIPRAATDEDLERFVHGFRDAARRCVAAGFGGVELHGAHGYLLCQFLSTVQNTRTDGWGGSLEHRARLLREVTRAVRAAVPGDVAVGVRLSPESMGQAAGLDVDESLQIAAWLVEDGVDWIHLSLWNAEKNTAKHPDRHPIPMFREVVPSEVALFAAGNLWSSDDVQRVLDLGADVVSVGRAAIVDPDWPKHVLSGEPPVRAPRTPTQYAEVEVGDAFVAYLRRFRLVEDA
ncbi:MAG: NADH:flavin oxidoreductase [Alphaproteobacteria bacterium]|nr:NADH:flavin oxidoreductase [Alphaproteobacteria bacterium]MCB9696047.1 NADH:flavin oxidoreductase [Alphaproteobacteria bacterium]